MEYIKNNVFETFAAISVHLFLFRFHHHVHKCILCFSIFKFFAAFLSFKLNLFRDFIVLNINCTLHSAMHPDSRIYVKSVRYNFCTGIECITLKMQFCICICIYIKILAGIQSDHFHFERRKPASERAIAAFWLQFSRRNFDVKCECECILSK